ncbi:MAG: transglycosylase SLT domain-containing protein [candidate division WOR-3 bacterium]
MPIAILVIATSPRLAHDPGELCNPMLYMSPGADTFDLNAFIERELSWRPGYWRRALENSRLYWPMISRKVKDAGLPEELVWLPLIESAFEPQALSRKGALGLWQFVPSTAKAEGLVVNMWVDERLDPVKSTDAALRHLRSLYALFGDWNLALAAYNAGSGRVWWALYQASLGGKKRRRRIPRQVKEMWLRQGDVWDFWLAQEYFPKETRRYVPLFYTGLAAVERAGQFGVNLSDTLSYPLASDTVLVDYPTDLALVAELLGLPIDSISLRNPELAVGLTPPDTLWPLRVPPGMGQGLDSALKTIEPREVTIWISYKAQRGDNLWKLAKRYGTTPEHLAEVNGLSLKKKLRLYQRLKIPKKVKARSRRDEIYMGKG